MDIKQAFKRSVLRVATAGSVDDGKSTLIGRLLIESNSVYEDQVKNPKDETEYLAQITDGLRAEREQGITIDVAYRYLTTKRRRIIIADTPGHEQYTRNMATGASDADVAIVLVDASKGISTQTKRHAFIASLMGVPRIVLGVNKMDLVKFNEEKFEAITTEFLDFASKLAITDIRSIPLSALEGDNVFKLSDKTPWFSGQSLYDYLDRVYIDADRNQVDFRFPVQTSLKVGQRRLFAGRVSSGSIGVGEEVLILPAYRNSQVKDIISVSPDGKETSVKTALANKSISIELTDQVDVSRGAMIVRKHNAPKVDDRFDGLIVWMDIDDFDQDANYYLQHTTNITKCKINSVLYKIDVNTLKRTSEFPITTNDIARVKIRTSSPLCLDSYRSNRATGGFILVNPTSNHTVAAGVVLDRQAQDITISEGNLDPSPKAKSENIHHESSKITQEEKEQQTGTKGVTIWFTGLSSSGKSTLAKLLERELFDQGKTVMRLDGDNMRAGLNADLGFSKADRTENIRRLTHVAKLFNDAGVICLVCAITPFDADREFARSIITPERFRLIHLETPLEECEKRDPHGLYAKARSGEIESFTGVSAPFEQPSNADLSLDTSKTSIADCLERLKDMLSRVCR